MVKRLFFQLLAIRLKRFENAFHRILSARLYSFSRVRKGADGREIKETRRDVGIAFDFQSKRLADSFMHGKYVR